MKKLVGKFGQRYNTAAIWEYVNPILIEGEMGIESDTKLFKFGDGVTPWNDLGYAGGGGASAVDATLTKSGMAADAKVTGDRIAAIDAKMFTGTKEEYKSAYAAGLIAIGTIVNITDDEELTDEDDDSGGDGETESFIVSVLPEPTVLYRGRIFILDNGTEDVPYICLKKSGSYGWYTLGGGGESYEDASHWYV